MTVNLLRLVVALWVLACAVLAQAQTKAPALALFSSANSDQPPAPWRVVGVPGGKIPLTSYAIGEMDGRKVLRVETNKSYGNLVHPLSAREPDVGVRLSWRWRLDEPLRGADLRRRDGDDSPLKVCALFDMPLENSG